LFQKGSQEPFFLVFFRPRTGALPPARRTAFLQPAIFKPDRRLGAAAPHSGTIAVFLRRAPRLDIAVAGLAVLPVRRGPVRGRSIF
jgi:hypothetical protein